MIVMLELLLELKNVEGGWNNTRIIMRHKILQLAYVLLSYTYGSIRISRGPNYFFVAIPRNMKLFDVASTNMHG